ncbi:MAG: helix-turn-helix domain-containing protein [Oscillospiraceae bacterium]|nr:helix-turn-helix domain-containing protein [Oscillospiraceae bacterium]
MNVEIANRLQQLRKKNELSQEELAEKIGVSRQAVSKWERAEASPDTDNLILLSKLYKVSLDELLRTDSEPLEAVSLKKEDYGYTEEPVREKLPDDYTNDEIYPGRDQSEPPKGAPFDTDTAGNGQSDIADKIGKAGRAIGDVINAAGQKINQELTSEKKKDFESRVENGMERLGSAFDRLGQKIDGMTKDESFSGHKHKKEKKSRPVAEHRSARERPPMTLFDKLFPFIIVSGFFMAVAIGLAHPGWVLFLLIPFYYTTKTALKNKNLMQFCYPLLCAIIYFGGAGFFDIFRMYRFEGYWYEIMWLLFLTIPLYYTGISALKKRNPLIFCYPVLCVIIYVGIGLVLEHLSWWFGNIWWSSAWAPLGLSIPVYYIVITHFRNKKNS